MEISATAAIAASLGVTKVFEYNRENFMEDREQRMKKEFAERNYRISQASLWRQDVRDFVSLTEWKMSLYLIVNVLLLGFTMTLWCEGQLPESTPDWLVMGYQIAAVVAFSFLLLTVWLAMHAGVAAKSYKTRVMTQLVRLPLPTWRELEACRTYASEFEKLDSRQMFRVPFVTGSQESFVPGTTAAAAATQDTSTDLGIFGNESPTEDTAALATDPWGLERCSDDIYELGVKSGSEVAKLRHMRLIRQAAVYWQTYDAFARVSMSVGINQLMLAISYYILGYALLDVKAPMAALGGVVVLMGTSEVIVRVDLTLPLLTQRLLQFLLGIGPVLSFMAAYFWSKQVESSFLTAELLAPIAYISNGLVIGLITIFVQVEEQENGAMLPRAFQGVLFLDVFGWVPHKDIEDSGPEPGAGRSLQGENDGTLASQRHAKTRPAASLVYNNEGHSIPQRPSDWAEPQDMRHLPGAPRTWDKVNAIEPPAKEFWDPVTFMPPESRYRQMVDEMLIEGSDAELTKTSKAYYLDKDYEAPIETGHDNEVPGVVPWRVFRNAAFITCVIWIFAGVGCVLKASVPRLKDLGMAYKDDVAHHHKAGKHRNILSFFGGLSGAQQYQTDKAEEIKVKWPYHGIVPRGLACDGGNRHLLVTDGLSTYLADVSHEDRKESSQLTKHKSLRESSQSDTKYKISAQFKQVASCPALLGENLQDTALSCSGSSSSDCEVLVLHHQGQRLAKCSLQREQGGETFSVANGWLSSSGEQAKWLLLDRACAGSSTDSPIQKECTSVGTTHGRSARLQLGQLGNDLVPLDVMDRKEKDADQQSSQVSSMRSLTQRYVGVLHGATKTLDIVDLDEGGAVAAKIRLNVDKDVHSFCSNGEYIYLMGTGVHPKMWRVSYPESLVSNIAL
jgi:hypothetical protein